MLPLYTATNFWWNIPDHLKIHLASFTGNKLTPTSVGNFQTQFRQISKNNLSEQLQTRQTFIAIQYFDSAQDGTPIYGKSYACCFIDESGTQYVYPPPPPSHTSLHIKSPTC